MICISHHSSENTEILYIFLLQQGLVKACQVIVSWSLVEHFGNSASHGTFFHHLIFKGVKVKVDPYSCSRKCYIVYLKYFWQISKVSWSWNVMLSLIVIMPFICHQKMQQNLNNTTICFLWDIPYFVFCIFPKEFNKTPIISFNRDRSFH